MSSNFEIPTSKYTLILGAKLDKLPNQDEAIELFQVWKKEHERVYSDLEVTAKKFGIFVTNLKYITESNAKRDSSHSVLLGLTKFADLSFMEFKETYMTLNTNTMDIVNDEIPNSVNSGIDSYHLVERSDKGLLCAVAKQPLNVSIYANSPEFQHYTSGIFRGEDCPVDSLDVTHGMVIVGYNSIDNEDYWIVKNSYGKSWGLNGYMYIKRNTDKKYGVAAINAWATEIVKNK
ncbi:hypothetical protein RYX36_001188 [Vicia faba]